MTPPAPPAPVYRGACRGSAVGAAPFSFCHDPNSERTAEYFSLSRPAVGPAGTAENNFRMHSARERSSNHSGLLQPHREHQRGGKDEGQGQAGPKAVDAERGFETERIADGQSDNSISHQVDH